MTYNSMFRMRSKSEMKSCYSNPTMLIAFVALVLVVVSCFIPFYLQTARSVSLTKEMLINSPFGPVVQLVTIIDIIAIVAAFVLSLLFKNSPKLSALNMALGGIILISVIFEFLYITKIGYPKDGGSIVNACSLSYGAFAVIISSLLIVGNEFYKLGWQGYEVYQDEKVQANEQVVQPQQVEQNEQFEMVEQREEQVPKFIKCRFCGAKNESSSLECHGCGATLDIE